MTLTWQDYRNWLGDTAISAMPEKSQAPAATSWGTDSRSIAKGTWFVPIRGELFNGHKFINSAMENGAQGFIYDKDSKSDFHEKYREFGIMVTDTLVAYQQIAAGWRTTLNKTRIAAITGSVGKTTTKEMIACVFREAGNCFSTHGSFNNEIGVPKSVLAIKKTDEYAVLEFGAKRLGNIKFLCEIAKPDISVLLNVGVAHLGIFGSLENLRNTKLEIFRNSPKHAILIVHRDEDKNFIPAKETGKTIISFGHHPESDVRIMKSEIDTTKGLTHFELQYKSKIFKAMLKTCHKAFPVNAAAAIATGIAAGIPMDVAIKGLAAFEPVAGRFKIMRGENLVAIDDTYNANPDSMKAGILSVVEQFPGKKMNLLLGGMLELGDDSAKMHGEIGEFLARYPVNNLVTVGADANYIGESFNASIKNSGKIYHFNTVEDAIKHSADILNGAEVLFVKGSNGIGLTQFLSHLKTNGILQ
jgi:UDP-N-acetylmuramoyl-tripeptide--D-alanyl-D-alanine ligase